MNTNKILMQVRSRLKDTNYEDLRFADEELLDCLYSTMLVLDLEFENNIATFERDFAQGDDVLFLGENFALKVISAHLDNKPIPYTTQQNVMRAQPHTPTLCSKNANTFFLVPFARGHLRLCVSLAPSKPQANEELPYSELFNNALVYGVMTRILEVETNPQNLEKSQFYAAQFAKECALLRKSLSSVREPTNLRTPFIKV